MWIYPGQSSCSSAGAAGTHRLHAQVRRVGDGERGASEREQTRCKPRRKRAGGAQVTVHPTLVAEVAGDENVELGEVRPGPDVAGNGAHQHRGESPLLPTNVKGQDKGDGRIR